MGRVSGEPIAGLATRRVAVKLYHQVIERKIPLDILIDSKSNDTFYRRLTAQDRSLVRAIVSTAFRRRGQVQDAIQRLLKTKLPKKGGPLASILDIAATQILFMEVADHAAVSLAVEMTSMDRNARHFKGMVNGLLRELIRQREDILNDQDGERLNTSDWLWKRWVKNYGEEKTRHIAAAHLVEPVLDLTPKSNFDALPDGLDGYLLPTGGLRLIHGGNVRALPGYDAGEWWVQDVAASLPARLLKAEPGMSIADLCAAPGGKTAQLAATGADVLAIDQSKTRLERLHSNMERLALSVKTVVADILDYQPRELYDAVLLDAPCSATGTLRRHPDVAWLKCEKDIKSLSLIQARMLRSAIQLLRPGGILIYCTCSLEPEEGEEQIAALLKEKTSVVHVPIHADELCGFSNCITSSGYMRSLPYYMDHQNQRLGGMDGFFAARLQRVA